MEYPCYGCRCCFALGCWQLLIGFICRHCRAHMFNVNFSEWRCYEMCYIELCQFARFVVTVILLTALNILNDLCLYLLFWALWCNTFLYCHYHYETASYQIPQGNTLLGIGPPVTERECDVTMSHIRWRSWSHLANSIFGSVLPMNTLCLKKKTLTLHTITSMHINWFW